MSKVLFKNNTAAIKEATVIVGRHVATADEATANAVVINLSNDLAVIEGATFTILRSGNIIQTDADLTYSGATMTFADGSTYSVTAGDVITYVAFGSLTN